MKISTLIMILMVSCTIRAGQSCSFSFDDCPESFNGKVINVPKNVMSFSPYFKTCTFTRTIETAGVIDSSLTVMFIIDHSNSMLGEDIDIPRDVNGSRFLVTRALIDTLQKKYPHASVGLIVFRDLLFFDTKDNPVFIPLPDAYPYPKKEATQGYIPPLRLDSLLSDGKTGAEFLKKMLETRSVTVKNSNGKSLESTDLVYESGFERTGGTNINVAFDAARAAFTRVSTPKENQFIIFLSDGEANARSGDMKVDDYVKGVGLPATFTVFFTPGESESAPDNIVKMTENIKTNNYSLKNKNSNLWTIKTSVETLMGLMMNNIISSIEPVMVSSTQIPKALQIDQKTFYPVSDNSTTFYIENGLKLNDSLTHFSMKIDYANESSSAKNQADTSLTIAFDVLRTDLKSSDGISIDCKDTADCLISINSTDRSASEADGDEAVFDIQRTVSTGSLTVHYSIGGTAANSIDYSAIADSITFKDGDTIEKIRIIPFQDSLEEGDETVILTLKDNADYHIDGIAKAEITIKDNFIVHDTLNIRVLKNPFSFNTGIDLPDNIKSMYSDIIATNSQGTIISVFSSIELKPVSGTDIFGYGYIYDAVGNLLQKVNLKRARQVGTGSYGMFWDGKNKNNRNVGAGTYLIKVSVKNIRDHENVLRDKIGIRN